MKPTDEQLNIAMMEALGYEQTEEEVSSYCYGKTRQCPSSGAYFATVWYFPCDEDNPENWLPELPNFCEDRNATPQILDAVEQAGAWEPFVRVLFGFQRTSYRLIFELWRAEPKTVVFAALKALGKWQDDWDE